MDNGINKTEDDFCNTHIHHKNIQKVAIEMYKVVNSISPQIMKELFYKANPSVTRSNNCFVQLHKNTVFKGDNSLSVFGPIVWDQMLPSYLKSCDSLNKFRNAVKNWIPNNCVCRLCKQYVTDLGYIWNTKYQSYNSVACLLNFALFIFMITENKLFYFLMCSTSLLICPA